MSQFQRWAAPTCLIFHKIYMIYEIIDRTGGLLSMNRMSPWAVGANSRLHDCFTPIFNLVLKENGAVSALKRWAAPTLWIFHRVDLIYIISNFLPPPKRVNTSASGVNSETCPLLWSTSTSTSAAVTSSPSRPPPTPLPTGRTRNWPIPFRFHSNFSPFLVDISQSGE